MSEVPLYVSFLHQHVFHQKRHVREREFFIDNLLVRIH